MMFRSVFYVAPVLAIDRAHLELLQRASADLSDQTVRSLEENLLSKGGNLDYARCTYYMKSVHPGNENLPVGLTPCNYIDELEECYEEGLDDFEDIGKAGKKHVKSIKDKFGKSLSDGTFKDEDAVDNLNLLDFEASFKSLELDKSKFAKSFEKCAKDIGEKTKPLASIWTAPDHEDAEESFYFGIMESLKEEWETVMTEVMENIDSVLRGELDIDVDAKLLDKAALAKHLTEDSKSATEAKKLIEKYLNHEMEKFVNSAGKVYIGHWKELLNFDDNLVEYDEKTPDPFVGLDWNKESDVKKAEKQWYEISRFFIESSSDAGTDAIEPICTSAKHDSTKPALRQVCKGGKNPKCIDEFMFKTGGQTEDMCEYVRKEVPRKVQGKKFTDTKFKDWCKDDTTCDVEFKECKKDEDGFAVDADCDDGAMGGMKFCKKPKDLKRACKKVAKNAKRALKKAKKTCKKKCNTDRKECRKTKSRRECGKLRKTCRSDCNDMEEVPSDGDSQ